MERWHTRQTHTHTLFHSYSHNMKKALKCKTLGTYSYLGQYEATIHIPGVHKERESIKLHVPAYKHCVTGT